MKILLTTFCFPYGARLRVFLDHFCRWLVDNLPQDQVDVKFLVYDQYRQDVVESHIGERYPFIFISDTEMREITGDISVDELNRKMKESDSSLSDKQVAELRRITQEKIPDWTPDIIISHAFVPGYKIWKDVFPEALCLSDENGVFCRPPFKRTISYDPFSSAPDWFPAQFRREIEKFKISWKERWKLRKLKRALRCLIDKDSPLKAEMDYYQKKFKKLVLLPLISEYFVHLFADCIYSSELELVDEVMKNTPKDVGVFVTQHDSSASLKPEDIQNFRNKYPNFIFLDKTDSRGYASNSLYYMKYIDAIINITSKTALMGLIWDKPVLSLAKRYNLWFQDGQGMADLKKVLKKTGKNKDNRLYWYFTHYVLFENDLYKKDFLWNFLNNCLEKYKNKGITFDFYDKMNTLDRIFEYMIGDSFKEKGMLSIIWKRFKRIFFSIKKGEDYNKVRILFFKFKRKKHGK